MYGRIAQLVERSANNATVVGSTPPVTILFVTKQENISFCIILRKMCRRVLSVPLSASTLKPKVIKRHVFQSRY